MRTVLTMVYSADGSTEVPGTVTHLLRRWRSGDSAVIDELAGLIYPELRQLARGRLAIRRDGELSPTELVHEAFLRLARQPQPDWANRAHFYYIAARLMRQVLVDLARERLSVKRGAGCRPLSLDQLDDVIARPGLSLLSLDEALHSLAAFDQRKAQAIEMRYFGGMTVEEIGNVLGIASATVTRDLRAAKAWLRAHLESAESVR